MEIKHFNCIYRGNKYTIFNKEYGNYIVFQFKKYIFAPMMCATIQCKR